MPKVVLVDRENYEPKEAVYRKSFCPKHENPNTQSASEYEMGETEYYFGDNGEISQFEQVDSEPWGES